MILSELKQGRYDNVAVLFTDIRNFTKFTADLPIEEVMQLLRIYFDKMAGIIMANHGVVGIFVGDAIVGYFGLDKVEHRIDNAAKAALQIKEQIRFINIGRNVPILNGMGLDKGSVIIGNVLTNDALKQTIVVGTPINRASRFERLTRISCHRIIMPKLFYEQLSPKQQEPFIAIGRVEVRGIPGLVHLYGDIVEKVE